MTCDDAGSEGALTLFRSKVPRPARDSAFDALGAGTGWGVLAGADGLGALRGAGERGAGAPQVCGPLKNVYNPGQRHCIFMVFTASATEASAVEQPLLQPGKRFVRLPASGQHAPSHCPVEYG